MEEAEKQERDPDEKLLPTEVGIGGFEYSGDFVTTDFLPQLQWPQAGKVYEEMSKNDPTIGAILFMAKQLVRRSKWKVVGGKSGKDLQARQFVESCMNDMEQSWNEFIAEVLSMMVYGWSYHEVVYKYRRGENDKPKYNSKFSDGMIGWRKFASRSQRTCYGWEIDQTNGDILALKQQAAPDYSMRVIPISKSIHFKTENDYGNPYGRSLLRSAYRPWFFKKRIEEIEGIGIERDLAGLPVLTPPEGVDIWNTTEPALIHQRNMAETLVKNVRRDQSEGLVIPFGWSFQLLSTGSKRQFDTNQVLNRYDQRIAITILADIVMLGADKVGSFALADVKKSLLCAALETLLESVADAINRQEVPRLMRLNGFTGLTEMPRLEPEDVETPTLEELSSLLKAMNDVGMNVADPEIEEALRSMASLPATENTLLEIKRKLYEKSIKEPPAPIVPKGAGETLPGEEADPKEDEDPKLEQEEKPEK